MSWLDILKKNDKEFDTGLDMSQIEEEKVEDDLFFHWILKDPDDEFDRLFLSKITEIKCELQDYCIEQALPFLDSFSRNEYGFYDFIKETSYQYYEIKENVENENEEIRNMEDEPYDEELYDSFEY